MRHVTRPVCLPRRILGPMSLIVALLATACSGPSGSPAGGSAGVPVSPMAGAATTTVQARDIYETVRLEGTVEAYDPVPVRASASGAFTPSSSVADGRTVAKGATVGTIRTCLAYATLPAPTSTAAPSGTAAPTGPPGAGASTGSDPEVRCTSTRTTTVRAPVAGVISGRDARDVRSGETVGSIQRKGLHIRLPVQDKSVLFNFVKPPQSGRAQLVGGPAGFKATYEEIVYAKDSGDVTVFAAMPSSVKAFAGLGAVVVFVTAKKSKVPTLPRSAVRGREGQGQVVVLGTDGSRSTVDVTLGEADDAYVEVHGVDSGTTVLLYPLESDFDG